MRSTPVASPDSACKAPLRRVEARIVTLTTSYLLSGGDVWPKQPAPADHPWRSMRNPKSGGGNAMVAHYSGTTLDAQIRYANGAISILDNWLNGKAQVPENVIVENGDYATKAYGQREKK